MPHVKAFSRVDFDMDWDMTLGVSMQSVPMYLSEIAPPKLRGALNFMFQLATTSGILIAQLVNYGALVCSLINLLLHDGRCQPAVHA